MSATKVYSNKQEKMIASYLGWSVVSGSGARDFHPGDIISDDWIGECKTHVKLQDNIVFYKQHWLKIQKEALSVNKYPALFVDNGSQQIDKTWVVFNVKLIQPDECDIVEIPKIHVNTNMMFKECEVRTIYNTLSRYSKPGTFIILRGFLGDTVGVVPVSTFYDMFSRG